MRNQEKQLTPAQRELLRFCESTDASALYNSLSTTLGVCILNHTRRYIEENVPEGPTEAVLEAWYFTLELMRHLHAIAVEAAAAAR